MASGQHRSIPHQASLKPREISYRESLVRVTHIGAITGGIFIFFFMVLYWALDYPRILVFISLAALLMDLAGLGLVRYFHIHKPAAHLVTLALYSALLGSALYTGGIDASSLVWLMFVPIAATIMAGTTDGIVWSAISLSSVLGVYLLNRSLAIDLTLLPSQSVDRLIDLSTVALASGIAIAINERTKARAMDRLENAQAMLTHLATVDPLTNVFNRRYFFDRAQIELEMDRLRKSRTSIILLDIDHFKKINDSYGHNVGDQILIGIVAICQENLRETDTLARLGGEEFVILLPNTDLAEARHLAERLRKKLEDTPIKTEAGPLHATISLGVTSHPTSGAMLPVQKLVQGADQAMYLAKRAGRNRVAIWQDQEPLQHRVD